MQDWIRRTVLLIIVAFVVLAIFLYVKEPLLLKPEAMEYYINSFIKDTGAENAVTAIYLNYRVFDTFFEALLLMISVTGIIYFLEEKGQDDTE